MHLDTEVEERAGDARHDSSLDCVLGFAFGFRGDSKRREPGLTNEYLARCAASFPDRIPLIAQEEIADAVGPRRLVTALPSVRPGGKYVDTRTLAVEMADLARSRSYRSAVVLAHPMHMPRVLQSLKLVGLEARPAEGLEDAPFDPESAQTWTRGPVRWRVREVLSREYYRLRGWI